MLYQKSLDIQPLSSKFGGIVFFLISGIMPCIMALKKAAKTKTKKIISRALKTEEQVLQTTFLNLLKLRPSKKTYFTVSIVAGILVLAYIVSRFLIVAWVDKQPITAFEYYNELNKKYGNDLREQMIVEKLLLNEAKKKGITVSDQDIAQETKKIEDAQGGADQLKQLLQMQGLSQDEFKKLVRLQTYKQKVFGAGVVIPDDVVDKFIENNKDQFKDIDSKTKESVREQLKQQKINTNFNAFLKDALKSSRVVRI